MSEQYSPSWLDFVSLLGNGGNEIGRDTLESQKADLASDLGLVKYDLDRYEERYKEHIEQAPHADEPGQYYEKAVIDIQSFRKKRSQCERLAREYLTLSILTTVDDRYGDLQETELDESDALSDRQRDIGRTVFRDREIGSIQSTLDRRLDDSQLPSEYRECIDETGSGVAASIDAADHPKHEQKIKWIKQITDAVFKETTTAVAGSSLPDDLQDFSDLRTAYDRSNDLR